MSTAWFNRDKACRECGFPVMTVCCNGSMAEHPVYSKWDWWMYCTNKACENHQGEGIHQFDPDWIVHSPEK